MREDPWTDQWAEPPEALFGTPPPPPPAQPDPWFPHFLRYLGVFFLISAANAVCFAGLIILAELMENTGRRRRDVLLALIPFVGAVFVVQTLWRATARNVYWSTREDRESEVLQGNLRLGAIGLGWFFALGGAAAIAILAATGGLTGWTSFDKSEFKRGIVSEGVDERTAQCVTDYYVSQFPDGPHSIPDEEPGATEVAQSAFSFCESGG